MSARILVTDGGSGAARSSLAAVRLLGQAGHDVTVTVSGPASIAAASRWASAAHAVPAVKDDARAYAAAVRAIDADLVVACSDAAQMAIGDAAAAFFDKATLEARAAAAGLRTPPTRVFPDEGALVTAARELRYPVVVKPSVSSSPARRIDTAAALTISGAAGPMLVQPFVPGPMIAFSGVTDGERMRASVQQRYLRTWPVDCGTSSAAITEEPDPELESKLTTLLHGYQGMFQAQFRDGHLLDLNLRPYGSLLLAAAAGVDLMSMHVDLRLGRPLPDQVLRGRPGLRYRWTEGDVRHAWHEIRRGRFGVVVSALPRSGMVHSVWSWRDPRPAFTRLRLARARAVA